MGHSDFHQIDYLGMLKSLILGSLLSVIFVVKMDIVHLNVITEEIIPINPMDH